MAKTDKKTKIESCAVFYNPKPLTLGQKLKLVRGKLHRFYVGHFDKKFVTKRLAERKGECARCGACCRLLLRCAFAAQCKEGIGCKIYTKRPINCRIFPLHARDLSERDMYLPEKKCGYHFDE